MRGSILISSIAISMLFCLVMVSESLAGTSGGAGQFSNNCLTAVPLQADDDDLEYLCRVRNDDNTDDDDLWEVEFESNFDDDDLLMNVEFGPLNVDDDDHENHDIPCECKSTGSFSNLNFEASNRFLCADVVSAEDDDDTANDVFSFGGNPVVKKGETRIMEGEAMLVIYDDDDADFSDVQCNPVVDD